MAKKKYELQAGRTILKDGMPFAYIGNSGGVPVELDKFAREVVSLMNLLEHCSKDDNILFTAKELIEMIDL